MTEQEAKTKWCPMFRASLGITPAGEREVIDNRNDGEASTRCIGSACMAWRWTGEGKPEPNGGPVGFCGLAGAPNAR